LSAFPKYVSIVLLLPSLANAVPNVIRYQGNLNDSHDAQDISDIAMLEKARKYLEEKNG